MGYGPQCHVPSARFDAGGAVADEGPHARQVVGRREVELLGCDEEQRRLAGQRHEGLRRPMMAVEVIAPQLGPVVVQHVEVEDLFAP